MPTYEYKCDACGYEFERFQPITADPIKRCPECGKAKVRRLIGTGAGMIFKGSGFYITDYRDKSYAEKAKAESGAGSSDAKSDAKPADTKGQNKPAEAKSSGGESSGSSSSSGGAGGAGGKGDAKPAASEPQPRASKSAKKK
jgi:putative FmdB family regulatory protein